MVGSLRALVIGVIALLLLPVGGAVVLLLVALTGLTDEVWTSFFSLPGLAESWWMSLLVAVFATTIALYASLLIAAATMQNPHSPHWQRVQRWLAPLLAVPHVAFAIGLLFLLSPSGWLVRGIHSLTGWFDWPPQSGWLDERSLVTLVIVLVLKEIPFLLFMLAASAQQLPIRQWLTVGASFGQSQRQTWWVVVLPRLVKDLRLPLLAVAVYSLAVVDIALLTAPNAPAPLAVRVLEWQLRFVPEQLGFAAIGSFLLLLTGGLLWLLLRAHESWINWTSRQHQWHQWRPVLLPLIRLGNGWVPAAATLSLLILTVLTLWSVAKGWAYPQVLPEQFTLSHWQQEWAYLQAPLAATFYLGLVSSLVAVSGAILLLEYEQRKPRAWLQWWVLLPLLLPQLTLVIGWQLGIAELGLSNSSVSYWGQVILTHCIFALPYAYLTLRGHYLAFDQRYMQVALSFGKRPLVAWWRVKLPVLLTPILFSAAIAFAVSVAQYVPTLLLGAGRVSTITTEAVALASGGDRPLTSLYALMQALLPMLMFAVVLLLARRQAASTRTTATRTTGVA